LRERTAALLVAALQRCGRRAEAVQVYHGLQQRLARQTGAGPSVGPPARNRSVALLAIGDRYLNGGDVDRALSCFYSARAAARDGHDRAELSRASQRIAAVQATAVGDVVPPQRVA
jgi:hypothetical protein